MSHQNLIPNGGGNETQKQVAEVPILPMAAPIISWIPARLIYVAKGAAGISVEINQIPRYLLEARRLRGWVDVNGRIWKQEFTMLSERGKNRIYLLATGTGGKMLWEFYKQGVKRIFVMGLEPAP